MSDDEDEIIVTVRGDSVELRDTANDATVPGVVQLDKLRKDTIEAFQSLLTDSRLRRRTEFEVLGRHLFDALFNGEVRQAFVQKLESAGGKQLRVQLSFAEGAEALASWPWEYLYYAPQNGRKFFLSTEVQLVLTRYMSLITGREEELAPGEKLRLLVAVSQPSDKDLVPVAADPVIEAIEGLAAKYPIQIEQLKKPTIDKLQEKLASFRPHVLHFMGHGRFNTKENQGEIALLAYDETSVMWVADKVFAEFFSQMQSIPRLVLLHLCEGGTVDLEASFAGLAPQLILTGVQAVVAMQHPITNLAASVFSRAFYKELVEGKTIDYAVQRGRYKIATDFAAYTDRAFGTPVMYLRSRNNHLFKNMAGAAGQKSRSGEAGMSRSMPIVHPSEQTVAAARRVEEQRPASPAVPAAPVPFGQPTRAPLVEVPNGMNPPVFILKIKRSILTLARDEKVEDELVSSLLADINQLSDLQRIRAVVERREETTDQANLLRFYQAVCDTLDNLDRPGEQLP